MLTCCLSLMIILHFEYTATNNLFRIVLFDNWSRIIKKIDPTIRTCTRLNSSFSHVGQFMSDKKYFLLLSNQRPILKKYKITDWCSHNCCQKAHDLNPFFLHENKNEAISYLKAVLNEPNLIEWVETKFLNLYQLFFLFKLVLVAELLDKVFSYSWITTYM